MLHLRARPQDVPSIERRHERLIAGLSALDRERYRLKPEKLSTLDTSKVLPATEVSLTRGFPSRMKGFATYYNRDYAEDYGRCDDFLDLEFDPRDYDYNYVAREMFPTAVQAFSPYLGFIAHRDEWSSRKPFMEMRSEVRQFDLVNYYDRELCRRAFGLTPIQLGKRLKPLACEVKSDRNGTRLILTDEILGERVARRFGESLMRQVAR
jgi:hypothetical protein